MSVVRLTLVVLVTLKKMWWKMLLHYSLSLEFQQLCKANAGNRKGLDSIVKTNYEI